MVVLSCFSSLFFPMVSLGLALLSGMMPFGLPMAFAAFAVNIVADLLLLIDVVLFKVALLSCFEK